MNGRSGERTLLLESISKLEPPAKKPSGVDFKRKQALIAALRDTAYNLFASSSLRCLLIGSLIGEM